MDDLPLLDIGCAIGRRKRPHASEPFAPEQLVERMHAYGIDRALVYHRTARESAPAAGNEQLMRELRPYRELQPVWVALPHHTGEFAAPAKLCDELRDAQVRAVRLFPSRQDHFYPFADWCCGELLEMLGEQRVPLLLSLDDVTWSEVAAACRSYPTLPLVLTDVNYRIDRALYPLLARHDNLYVETYGYKVHWGIETLCARFGPGRLVFGSGMPVFSGAAAVSMLSYAAVAAAARAAIGAGTFEQLLEDVAW